MFLPCLVRTPQFTMSAITHDTKHKNAFKGKTMTITKHNGYHRHTTPLIQ